MDDTKLNEIEEIKEDEQEENEEVLTEEGVKDPIELLIEQDNKRKKIIIIIILSILLILDIAALVIYLIGIDKVISFIR